MVCMNACSSDVLQCLQLPPLVRQTQTPCLPLLRPPERGVDTDDEDGEGKPLLSMHLGSSASLGYTVQWYRCFSIVCVHRFWVASRELFAEKEYIKTIT